MGLWFDANCCDSQASNLGRTVGCLPPLGACLESSGTMKVSIREKALESVQSQVPLGLYMKYMLSFVVVLKLYFSWSDQEDPRDSQTI